MHYLAVCAIYKNEATYLREWVEFHRLVGVEKFFLYDNRSTDDHREQLAPYLADGTVEVQPWPDHPGQISSYTHCLEAHRDDARWIAFIDIDEFLFSPRLVPLPKALAAYEKHPAVGVNRATFGSSGHKTQPDGLVIENYVWRAPERYYLSRQVKSIVDPRRTLKPRGNNSHVFLHSDGHPVCTNGDPLDSKPFSFSPKESTSFSGLRINHYLIKSEQQWKIKNIEPNVNRLEPRRRPPENPEEFSIEDKLIMAYAPELRAALRARA